MDESEYLVLSEWFNFLISSPQMDFRVDQIIYLRTNPEVAYERIKKRNRMEEHRIPFQYVKGKSYHFAYYLTNSFILDLHDIFCTYFYLNIYPSFKFWEPFYLCLLEGVHLLEIKKQPGFS